MTTDEALNLLPDDAEVELTRLKGGWLATVQTFLRQSEDDFVRIPYVGIAVSPGGAILSAVERWTEDRYVIGEDEDEI